MEFFGNNSRTTAKRNYYDSSKDYTPYGRSSSPSKDKMKKQLGVLKADRVRLSSLLAEHQDVLDKGYYFENGRHVLTDSDREYYLSEVELTKSKLADIELKLSDLQEKFSAIVSAV